MRQMRHAHINNIWNVQFAHDRHDDMPLLDPALLASASSPNRHPIVTRHPYASRYIPLPLAFLLSAFSLAVAYLRTSSNMDIAPRPLFAHAYGASTAAIRPSRLCIGPVAL